MCKNLKSKYGVAGKPSFLRFCITILFYLLVPQGANCEIVIKVLDNQSDVGVPFSIIIYNNKQLFITDSVGLVTLNDSFLHKEITVRNLGYFETSCVVSTRSFIVKLEQKEVELNEFLITAKDVSTHFKEHHLGCKSNKSEGTYNFKKGAIVARYIESKGLLKSTRSRAYIKSVGFYITSQGYPNSSFRIRVFSVDSSGFPSSDLLNHNVIVNANTIGGRWFDVSMMEYYIKIPREGFFVAMEWLKDDEIKSYMDQNTDSLRHFDGQVLGGVRDSRQAQTFVKSSRSGAWSIDEGGGSWFFRNLDAMVRADIVVFE